MPPHHRGFILRVTGSFGLWSSEQMRLSSLRGRRNWLRPVNHAQTIKYFMFFHFFGLILDFPFSLMAWNMKLCIHFSQDLQLCQLVTYTNASFSTFHNQIFHEHHTVRVWWQFSQIYKSLQFQATIIADESHTSHFDIEKCLCLYMESMELVHYTIHNGTGIDHTGCVDGQPYTEKWSSFDQTLWNNPDGQRNYATHAPKMHCLSCG